jgi:hypothetical protein
MTDAQTGIDELRLIPIPGEAGSVSLQGLVGVSRAHAYEIAHQLGPDAMVRIGRRGVRVRLAAVRAWMSINTVGACDAL